MARPSGQFSPSGNSSPGYAGPHDLRDGAREVRDEQPLADEGQVVQPRAEIGEHGAITGAWIDPQHLATVHLGGDDKALRVELDRVRHPQVAGHFLRFTAIETDAPDLVGSHHRDVEHAVRPHLHGVGHGHVLQHDARGAAIEVEFHDPPVGPALAGEQAALVEGDRICTVQAAAHYARRAVGGANADSPFGNLGDVEIAVGVEDQVVRRHNRAALGADGFDRAGRDIDRADLAA